MSYYIPTFPQRPPLYNGLFPLFQGGRCEEIHRLYSLYSLFIENTLVLSERSTYEKRFKWQPHPPSPSPPSESNDRKRLLNPKATSVNILGT